MSTALIGALVGLGIGIVDFAFLRLLATRVDLAETKTALNVAGVSQLVILPVIGYVVAPYLFGD
ncbi:hypothetical protein GTW25_06880 [Aliihoeflea aestuarii]|jgi:hypothetical protein|uniref:hypothetical protein n=1 Tax=Aliihoeflea aestuarii TaxID=453840 RepID=UPI0020936C1A|nr:hypothetical protein [Aliihoeflea aestuarii]MCO6390750.1 hypothetical protein [Aliihoeflea aestuarii]